MGNHKQITVLIENTIDWLECYIRQRGQRRPCGMWHEAKICTKWGSQTQAGGGWRTNVRLSPIGQVTSCWPYTGKQGSKVTCLRFYSEEGVQAVLVDYNFFLHQRFQNPPWAPPFPLLSHFLLSSPLPSPRDQIIPLASLIEGENLMTALRPKWAQLPWPICSPFPTPSPRGEGTECIT